MADVFKKGNTAVITGAASGIGFALAKRCVEAGMKVVMADSDGETLKKASESLGAGETVVPITMDVSKLDDWKQVSQTVCNGTFGGTLNLLALNAGIGPRASFLADPDAARVFERTFQVNVVGMTNGLASLLNLCLGGGGQRAAVVLTGSKQGITNPPGNPAYNASKAAVKALAEHLAFDLRGREELSVHLLVPGWTWTPLAGAGAGAGSETQEKPAAPWWPAQVVGFLEAKIADRQFWVLCPDNDVSEDMDRRRMQWTARDAVEGRPPLSRWREEYKGEFEEFMKG
ncbi:NAD(P)-binding protein [Xylariomycetidae sp. FL0641]|nr:NAD(P)-binding protein [Xylariomycetidae sp. FL0641]